jgi:hypothetical protein
MFSRESPQLSPRGFTKIFQELHRKFLPEKTLDENNFPHRKKTQSPCGKIEDCFSTEKCHLCGEINTRVEKLEDEKAQRG